MLLLLSLSLKFSPREARRRSSSGLVAARSSLYIVDQYCHGHGRGRRSTSSPSSTLASWFMSSASLPSIVSSLEKFFFVDLLSSSSVISPATLSQSLYSPHNSSFSLIFLLSMPSPPLSTLLLLPHDSLRLSFLLAIRLFQSTPLTTCPCTFRCTHS